MSTVSLSIALTAQCFAAPLAIRIIFFDFRIVAIPIVSALCGTSSADVKNLEFALIVLSVSKVRCVFVLSFALGSLKPI